MSGKKLVIAAAGTGGHVMPGLAVAREMRRRGWDIEWIGTQTGMEGGLVGRDDIVFHGLDFRGMIAWIVAGLPWDFVHGVSNFFCGLLICPLIALLRKAESLAYKS